MFTALTTTLAAAAVIATGAVVGASVPEPEEPTPDPGAAQTRHHGGDAGHHNHPDMAQMHEQMMAEHPEMVQMHERMMGGTGMMGGNSTMGV